MPDTSKLPGVVDEQLASHLKRRFLFSEGREPEPNSANGTLHRAADDLPRFSRSASRDSGSDFAAVGGQGGGNRDGNSGISMQCGAVSNLEDALGGQDSATVSVKEAHAELAHGDGPGGLFEGIPQDKARTLAELISKSDRERAAAVAHAEQLQEVVSELRGRLEASAGTGELPPGPPVPREASREEPLAGTSPPDLPAPGVARSPGRQLHLWWVCVTLAVVFAAVWHSLAAQADCRGSSAADSSLSHLGDRTLSRTAAEAPAAVGVVASGASDVSTSTKGMSTVTLVQAKNGAPTVGTLPPNVDGMALSAAVFGDVELEAFSGMLSEDQSVPRGFAPDLDFATEGFPNVRDSYRLGRLVLSRSEQQDNFALARARIYIANVGTVTWPADATLRLVSGADFSLVELPIGQPVEPASHAELTLQFRIPVQSAGADSADAVRSAWVLEAWGEPFGPLLLLEVTWI